MPRIVEPLPSYEFIDTDREIYEWEKDLDREQECERYV